MISFSGLLEKASESEVVRGMPFNMATSIPQASSPFQIVIVLEDMWRAALTSYY